MFQYSFPWVDEEDGVAKEEEAEMVKEENKVAEDGEGRRYGGDEAGGSGKGRGG